MEVWYVFVFAAQNIAKRPRSKILIVLFHFELVLHQQEKRPNYTGYSWFRFMNIHSYFNISRYIFALQLLLLLRSQIFSYKICCVFPAHDFHIDIVQLIGIGLIIVLSPQIFKLFDCLVYRSIMNLFYSIFGAKSSILYFSPPPPQHLFNLVIRFLTYFFLLII